MPWIGSLDSVKYLMKLPKVGKPKKSQLSAPVKTTSRKMQFCQNKYSCENNTSGFQWREYVVGKMSKVFIRWQPKRMRAKKNTIERINATTSRFFSKINLDLQHNHSTKVMHQVMETFKKDNFNQSHKNTWICVNGIVECKVSHKSSSRMLERSLWQAALTREGAFLKFGWEIWL